MSKKEEVKIENFKEFQKQHREDMLKSGHYARVELIVADNDDYPYDEFDIKHCNLETFMKMYVELKEAIEYLEKEYPEECKMATKLIKTEFMGDISAD